VKVPFKTIVHFLDENLLELGNSNIKKEPSLESFTQLNMGGDEV